MILQHDGFLWLCLTALCLPKTTWAADFIRALGTALRLPDESIQGAIPLLHTGEQSMLERAEEMAASLRPSISKESAIEGFITIVLIVLHGQELVSDKVLRFDARTSVVLRRLALLLRIRHSTLCKMEDLAIREMQRQTNLMALEADKALGTNKWVRIASVGAVAAATGGALALTGGLAAPALATGLAGLGLAGAATIATTTTVAALLGAGGAGFGAYKMTNRTKGVTHFEFQQINSQKQTQYTMRPDKNENNDRDNKQSTSGGALQQDATTEDELKGMTVYICISGFIQKAGPVSKSRISKSSTSISSMLFSGDPANSADFFNPWGAEPPVQSLNQVLDRFYSQVAPEKRKLVPHLLKRYAGQEKELLDELQTVYDVHPFKLAPPEAQPNHYVNQVEDEMYNELLKRGYNRLKSFMDNGGKEDIESLSIPAQAVDYIVDPEKSWTETCFVPKEEETQVEEEEVQEDEGETVGELKFEVVENNTDTNTTPTKRRNIMSKKTKEALESEMDNINLTCTPSKTSSSTTLEEKGDSGPCDTSTVPDSDDCSTEGSQYSEEDSQTTEETDVEGQSTSTNAKPSKDQIYWWRQSVANYGDQYSIIWEPDTLLAVGKCVEDIVKEGVSKSLQHSLSFTMLSAVAAAVAIPVAIVNFTNTLDNHWTLAVHSADESGGLLADALMSESNGNRPVVLIGFSAGGRMVASCLDKLAEIAYGEKARVTAKDEKSDMASNDLEQELQFLTQRIENDSNLTEKERKRRLRAATIVRDAVIIGAPVDTSSAKWAKRRSVVLGRLINVYNPLDWVLHLVYRYKHWSVLALSGLKPVTLLDKHKISVGDTTIGAPGIENYDVSDLVKSHGDYPSKMKEILQRIGVGDVHSENILPNYFP